MVWRELARSGLLGRFCVLCLGIWLHAADMLVTATLMPSVIAEIGGTAWIAWTISLYQIGGIVMGTAAGRLSRRVGLRVTLLAGAGAYALGCVAAAVAPDMAVLLAGRLVQGIGGGLLLSLSYVAIERMFPERFWIPLNAVTSALWGAASLGGPLIGGVFADLGSWRAAFWSFAAQAGVLLVLGWRLPRDRPAAAEPGRGDWRALAILSAGALAVSWAATVGGAAPAVALALAGVGLLVLAARVDAGSTARLMPSGLLHPWRPDGAGLAMVLGLAIGTCGFWTYGPLVLQVGFGVDPLLAGAIMAGESLAWSLATIVLATVALRADRGAIVAGSAIVAVGAGSLAVSVPGGHLPGIAVGVVLQGVGMGLAWPPIMRRMVGLGRTEERDLSAAAASVVQRVGYAVGAALCGLAGNAAGLVDGMAPAVARAGSVTVFAVAIPPLLLGVLAARRFAAPALPEVAVEPV